MRCVSWLTRLCLALVAVPLAAAGCAHVPGAYTMSPKAVACTRARLGTIGVVVAPYRAMLSFATPRRRWTSGNGDMPQGKQGSRVNC